MILLRAIAIWLPLLILAVLNGWAREEWLTPRLGELRAHQVSCFTGSLLILAASLRSTQYSGQTPYSGRLFGTPYRS